MRFACPVLTDRGFTLHTIAPKYEVLMAHLIFTRGSQIFSVLNFFIPLTILLRGDCLNFFLPNFIFLLLSQDCLIASKPHFFPPLTLLLIVDYLIVLPLHFLFIHLRAREANSRVLFTYRPQSDLSAS